MSTTDPVLHSPLSLVPAVLEELRANCLAAEADFEPWLRSVRAHHGASARNLVHYVALRRHDLRELQDVLTTCGLSSLGRCEGDVLGALDQLIEVVGALTGAGSAVRPTRAAARSILECNANALLGVLAAGRHSRVMVTLPTEAAVDPAVVGAMAEAGMDVARINCAHDDPTTWRAMARQVRQAADRRGRACAVAVDLAGPKLRTEITATGPVVRRVSPRRDGRGMVVAPARVLFHHQDDVPRDLPVDVVPVPVLERYWLRRCEVGDVVHLTDSRLSHRQLTVVVATGRMVLAELRKTAYVESGATLKVTRDGTGQIATVGSLPPLDASVLVSVDDEIVIGRDVRERVLVDGGRPWIGCTLPEALDGARVGDRIWFDDGKVGGVVSAVEDGELVVRIVEARSGGVRLRSGKGINLPDTELPVAGLTEQDERDLAVAVEFADIVNVSFVRSPSDVAFVQERLSQHGATDVGIVVKIETVSGFEQLPEILLAAMCWDRVGVMIARGDLAVEVGFERMAEVQEEILWLCEAAHVPVVWATQVLDQMARTGHPSRAEITDAALSARAECIMLNKGPYVAAAITALIDIHRRMHDHQHKKRALLRRLCAWDHRRAAT